MSTKALHYAQLSSWTNSVLQEYLIWFWELLKTHYWQPWHAVDDWHNNCVAWPRPNGWYATWLEPYATTDHTIYLQATCISCTSSTLYIYGIYQGVHWNEDTALIRTPFLSPRTVIYLANTDHFLCPNCVRIRGVNRPMGSTVHGLS